MGGASVLLVTALLWNVTRPSSSTLSLTWRAPRVAIGNLFAFNQPRAATAALQTPAPQRWAWPVLDYFGYDAAAKKPTGGHQLSGQANWSESPPHAPDSTASGRLTSGLYRYWRLIKLGFR